MRLTARVLAESAPAIAREAVRRAAQLAAGPEAQVSAERVEAALGLLTATGSARTVDLPGNASARREYDDLVFAKRARTRPGHSSTLDVGGDVAFLDWRLKLTERKGTSFDLRGFVRRRRDLREAFDADAVALPLTVRTRRPGDRMAVARGQTKKLKEILAEAKVPARQRDWVPIVTDARGRVLWAVSVRRAFAARVEKGTQRVLVVSARGTKK